MECFCHKVLHKHFDDITESEAIFLKTWAIWAGFVPGTQTQPLTPEQSVASSGRKRRLSTSKTRPRKQQRPLPDSPQAVLPVSKPVRDLNNTYSPQIISNALAEGFQLDISQNCGVGGHFSRLFLAVERTDLKIEIQQIFRRICCYGFALLHLKNTSVDRIVQEIQHAQPSVEENTIRNKVYNILRIGGKWKEIIGDFASISRCDPQQCRGLLCLLGSASTWERASKQDRRSTLDSLCTNTTIRELSVQCTPFVDKILDQVLLEHSFVNETNRIMSHMHPLSGANAIPRANLSNMLGTMPLRRRLHGSSRLEAPVRSPLEAAALVPDLGTVLSTDAKLLLLLLSFLSSEKISSGLFHGTRPRKRWNVRGEIEEDDPVEIGLATELRDVLANTARLRSAVDQLSLSSAARKNEDQTFTLDETIARRVRDQLPGEQALFWRLQALIVTYRMVTWKYVEKSVVDIRLCLPHLRHALHAVSGDFEALPVSTRTDLVLTLIEAARFPSLEWKRFVLKQAEHACQTIQDPHLHLPYRIAQTRSLVARIGGDMDRAVSSISGLKEPDPTDQIMHSAVGHVLIQRALNCIQVEDLSAAKKALEVWAPLGPIVAPVEQVIQFRNNMLLGRILRFEGAFSESLARLQRADNLANECKELVFHEDYRDLTCDHADTLRELGDLASAENLLRAEIARQAQDFSISGNQSLLDLCLAEVLFAGERFEEAEKLCFNIQHRPGLLRFEKLRLHITLAKIHHVASDYGKAFSSWCDAMKAIQSFQLTNGRATRVIVMSICDAMGADNPWLVHKSLDQIALLDQAAKPGGVQYWIAGMRHWWEFLESRKVHSRM